MKGILPQEEGFLGLAKKTRFQIGLNQGDKNLISPVHMSLVAPTIILIAGAIDDIRTRKVHNKLVLVLALIGLLSSVAIYQMDGLAQGGLAAIVALLILLPMVAAKILGAGDMKLMVAFGLASEPWTVVWTITYAMVIGALFGLVRAALSGQLKSMLQNTFKIMSKTGPKKQDLIQIPFTVPLLFGWITVAISTFHSGGH